MQNCSETSIEKGHRELKMSNGDNGDLVAWKEFGNKYPSLELFPGVLAVAFPSIATVEADFSAISSIKEGGGDSIGIYSPGKPALQVIWKILEL